MLSVPGEGLGVCTPTTGPRVFSQPHRGCASRPERMADLPRVTQPASSRDIMLTWSPTAPGPGVPRTFSPEALRAVPGTAMVLRGYTRFSPELEPQSLFL